VLQVRLSLALLTLAAALAAGLAASGRPGGVPRRLRRYGRREVRVPSGEGLSRCADWIGNLAQRQFPGTGARWIVRHAGPIVELVATADSPDWDNLWNN
jgi:hypothetical protein